MTSLKLLLEQVSVWRTYRKTRETLASLDVGTLVDIGVPWREIDAAARRAASVHRAN
jgi:uncharacterized protein YjiS (DUF1127 family)